MELQEIFIEFEELINNCINEIENDYTEEELKKWSRKFALDYLTEYLEFNK